VDPFSTGANIAASVMKMGYKVILVFSELNRFAALGVHVVVFNNLTPFPIYSPVAKLVSKSTSVQPTLLIQHNSSTSDQDSAVATTLAAIRGQGAPILAILPGAETGVELSDKLAAR